MSTADAIIELCASVGIEEPPGWREYQELVAAWNQRTDLTSARSDRELAEVLFLDAAHAIAGQWVPEGASLVDVGAGVGAPTIPILLSDGSLHGALVEPRRIRTAFLRTAIGALGLAGRVRAFEHRVDPARPVVEGAPFDIALSRATFAPEQWLRIGAALAAEVWTLTASDTPEPPETLHRVRVIDYRVPSSRAPRTLAAYRGTRSPSKT